MKLPCRMDTQSTFTKKAPQSCSFECILKMRTGPQTPNKMTHGLDLAWHSKVIWPMCRSAWEIKFPAQFAMHQTRHSRVACPGLWTLCAMPCPACFASQDELCTDASRTWKFGYDMMMPSLNGPPLCPKRLPTTGLHCGLLRSPLSDAALCWR